MALRETLSLSRTLYTIPELSSLLPSPNPVFSIRFALLRSFSNLKILRVRRRTACSAEYNGGQFDRVSYPRPAEIPWSKDLCNTVHLIGKVGTPIEIKHLSSGKTVAWTRLAVKKSATDTIWISLTFWDDLAHVAFQHVEKGQQIYVSGRLVSDTVESEDGRQQTYYKVVVQQLNFVARSFTSEVTNGFDSNSMMSGRKPGNYVANNISSTEELWQAFFANPLDWWDNRKNKKNPKYPDFKHKDTGESLWVEGRNNPPWVKAQLAILDLRMESLHDQDANMHVNFMSGDGFAPF
ncbi:Primosome PriB/single-strand DNA-binding [Dillenia turbinata]|uniref:Primosome PriB/single-strand DNA-binding n=1 Tax=Dillenia turbinata TaxID=194707 RepID=A0AAN8VXH5_9MAGN